MNKHKAIPLILSLLLSLTLLPGCTASAPSEAAAPPAPAAEDEAAPQQAPAETGAEAPEFAFAATSVDGEAVDATLFTDATLTMVNIWGTFCGYCLQEMPELSELNQEYADRGFQVVGIVGDVGDEKTAKADDLATVRRLIDETDADFLHLLPGKDINKLFLSKASVYPTSFFVDHQGKLLGEPVQGAIGKEKFAALIDTYLAELEAA